MQITLMHALDPKFGVLLERTLRALQRHNEEQINMAVEIDPLTNAVVALASAVTALASRVQPSIDLAAVEAAAAAVDKAVNDLNAINPAPAP